MSVIRGLHGTITPQEKQDYVTIQFQDAHSSPVSVKAIPKVKTQNPFKKLFWLCAGRPIPKGCIKLLIDNNSINVKVEEFAAKIGLLPEALTHPTDGVSPAKIIAERAHSLSTSYHNLYQLLSRSGVMVTPEGLKPVTVREFKIMKKVIRTAYITQAMYPTQSGDPIEDRLFVTKDLQLLIRSEERQLRVIGLFGVGIGHGNAGEIIHAVDLLSGQLAQNEKAVIKTLRRPIQLPHLQTKEISREASISHFLNRNGPVLGLAKSLTLLKSRTVESKIRKQTTHTIKTDTIHMGPLYPKGELFDIIKKKSLPTTQIRLWIAYQIAHGVSFMHSQHVLHRDIKAENVFVGEDLDVYLSDFAGSYIYPQEKPTHLVMTRVYCSPQDLRLLRTCAHDQIHMLRESMDVFATTILLYEILSNGAYPWNTACPYEDTTINWPKKHWDSLKENCSFLDKGTALLIHQGLAIEPYGRPSVEELRAALAKELQQKASHFCARI